MTTALPKLEKLKPNKNWAKLPLFNRKNWARVRFDDVVENLRACLKKTFYLAVRYAQVGLGKYLSNK